VCVNSTSTGVRDDKRASHIKYCMPARRPTFVREGGQQGGMNDDNCIVRR
jgi:hypothetical protein